MIKLNIGSGWRNFGKDWVHIDGGNYSHVSSHDIVNLPYSEGTIDLIYASHVFEYFDREEGIKVLSKWYSLLKKGGILRIAVPDFEVMAKLYHTRKAELKDLLGLLFGKMEMGMKGGQTGKIIYHKTVYNIKELSEMLKKTGFKQIRRYNWKNTPPHDKIDDHSQAYFPSKGFISTKEKPFDKEKGTLVSLNLEAIK